MAIRSIEEIEIGEKRVFLRVDFNVPLEGERVRDDTRIVAALPTIRYALSKGAKLILASHLGRPKGKVVEELRLDPVAHRLGELLGKPVRKLNDCIGPEVEQAVAQLGPGEVVLLENLRFHPGEEANDPEFAQALAKLAEAFVNDAFAAAHRSHASIVGFTVLLPTVAGRVMERELKALTEILEKRDRVILFMGGNKPKDCISVIDSILNRGRPEIKLLLSAGILGQLFLMAEGYDLGEPSLNYIRKKKFEEFLPKVKELKERLGDRLYRPIDVACELDGNRFEISVKMLPAPSEIMDIGGETANKYSELILSASREDAIIVKGPAGAYEKEIFRRGTYMIYRALSRSKAFTLIGGGDSSTAIRLVGLSPEDFSYVSLAGGALIHYLSGEKLPGVEILKKT